MFWVFRTSIANDVIAYQPTVIFSPTLENYTDLFQENGFGKHILNSLIVAFSSTLIAIPIAAFGAYALTRYKPGGTFMQLAVIGSDMMPPIIVVLPLFAIFMKFSLVNTLYGLTLSYLAFNLPFLLWLLMGFFEDIPKELEEAALIDGANRFQAFIRVVFPLSAPGIMAAGVLGFITCWNEFIFALILTGGKTSTIPVALAALQTSGGILIGRVSAGVVIATFPIIIISIFIQKYLVRGLTFGAIK